ncbi:hypothetical protein [Streptomyces sp. SP2-10]|uniref:hypothetical protein n=1 Tax=Streptomyces sp. SP2-10 TaxID=2873385 RepID=UPI001CA7AB84|nr:hypothetical protein [Streptomyces sp. SP2-10]MBY8844438.1 hypothetical protein [Streptomyces sp. SP2-10]
MRTIAISLKGPGFSQGLTEHHPVPQTSRSYVSNCLPGVERPEAGGERAMSHQSENPSDDGIGDTSEQTEEPAPQQPENGGASRGTARWAKAVGAVAALGGFGGLAVLVTSLTGVLAASPDSGRHDTGSPTPTGSPTVTSSAQPVSSVRIERPAARDDDQVTVGLCQEFSGRSHLVDGYTLWLAGRVAGETDYTIFGRADVSASTGKWRITAQLGGDGQTGAVFEVVAVPVPETVSDYLLKATDYQSRHLVPHGDGAPVVGLRDAALPPGADRGHSDSVKVRRGDEPGSC